VAVNLAAEMIELGHEVGIFYWDEKGDENYALDPRIKLYKPSNRFLPLRIFGLRSLLRKLSVDVVIGITDMANITAWIASSWVPDPPPCIATVHSDLRVRDAAVGLSFKTRFLRLLHRQACTHAAKVVAVSDGARDSLIEYFRLKPESVERIYNPVLQEAKSLARRTPNSDSVRIIAAGRLTQAKNYPVMIRAIKILTDRFNVSCHLDLYGTWALSEQLQALIDELDLSMQITLRGFVKNLPEKLAGSDVFLQSSSWEGFGNVLVEALHAGLKVIATDCPSGPREVLANGKFGVLVAPDEPLALATAIVEELHNPLVIDGLELQEHLRQFTTAKIAGEYLQVAKGLID
jgi:glycosyltransferase involved in cell wall biosynthesis